MCTSEQAVTILGEVYRDCSDIFKIHDAYLYGSYARGDYTDTSDVDILLTADTSREELAKYRSAIASVTSALSLKYDVTVSVTVKPAEQFEKYAGVVPYYQNVLNEGIRYAI